MYYLWASMALISVSTKIVKNKVPILRDCDRQPVDNLQITDVNCLVV
jgi:hypothetical protein